MRGVAAGSLIAYTISISVMGWYLFSGRARVVPKIRGLRIRWAMFVDILKVGAVSCFSPLQSVLTISIFTHMLAGFGTEILAGYGIGARLEFMLTSVAFAVGIASVPMIGMAIGAERDRARAADRLDRGHGLVRVGRRDRAPSSRSSRISGSTSSPDDADVRAASRQYLSTAAPMYAFIGLAMSMYFSSQGAAKVLGPGAGADRAAGVHRRRRLVAVDAWRDRREFLRAGGSVDGGARRAVLPERDPDALGTEARPVPAARPALS